MNSFVILAILATTIAIFGFNSAFAQTLHSVLIPTGAADPNAPYFWQVESTGNTDGEVTIKPLDTVVWQNADTQPHTVTSGTPAGDDVGEIFDSGLFQAGESFSYQFIETGSYDYFCMIHPWMVGVVNVVESMESNVKIIYNVAKELDESGDGFDVEYQLNRKLDSATVEPMRNTITLTLAGELDDDELVINLPEKLIKNPNSVWIDDVQITNFESEEKEDVTVLRIPLDGQTEEVVIMGSSVIPEFGAIVSIILATSFVTIIVLTLKKGNRLLTN